MARGVTPQEWRPSRLRSSPPPTEPRRTSYTPATTDESFPEEEEEEDWESRTRSVVGKPRGRRQSWSPGEDGLGVPVPQRWGLWRSLVWLPRRAAPGRGEEASGRAASARPRRGRGPSGGEGVESVCLSSLVICSQNSSELEPHPPDLAQMARWPPARALGSQASALAVDVVGLGALALKAPASALEEAPVGSRPCGGMLLPPGPSCPSGVCALD